MKITTSDAEDDLIRKMISRHLAPPGTIVFSDDECGRMRISTDGTPETEIDLKVLKATFTPVTP